MELNIAWPILARPPIRATPKPQSPAQKQAQTNKRLANIANAQKLAKGNAAGPKKTKGRFEL